MKGRERGLDIRLLNDLWRQCEMAAPETVINPMREADVVVLELHQDELLTALPRAALLDLIQKGYYFNDVRTIFLGHDKRLLAVFASDLLRDYLAGDDVETLHRNVVPTYVVGQGGDPVRLAQERHREWVLKPNLLGKGEGIVIGREVGPHAWRAALGAAPPHFVLQPYVEQRLFEVLDEVNGEVKPISMRVVGMLPDFDGQFFGPGIYRASTSEIVSVSGGGTILAPVVVTRGPSEKTVSQEPRRSMDDAGSHAPRD